MPDVHLLTDPTPGLTHVTMVCGARRPEYGTWDPRAVTCGACLTPVLDRDPGTCRAVPRAQTVSKVETIETPITEKAWLQQMRSLARAHHWRTYHPLHSPGSEAGFPDLTLCRPPTLYMVEIKTAAGRLTPAQRQWLDALSQVTTVHSAVWRPGDLDTIVDLLR